MKTAKTLSRNKVIGVPAPATLSKRDTPTASSSGETAGKSGNGPAVMTSEARHMAISLAAYSRAERRGFVNGSPEQDWLEAEIEVNLLYARQRTDRNGARDDSCRHI